MRSSEHSIQSKTTSVPSLRPMDETGSISTISESMAVMKKLKTVSNLFEQAIDNEEAMVGLYRGFVGLFSDVLDAAIIFNDLASDEERHAFELETVQKVLSKTVLTAPAHPEMIMKFEAIGKLSVKKMLKNIRNLEDAFGIIRSIEYGRLNDVFECTIKIDPSKEMIPLIQKEIIQHYTKIDVLFKRFPDQEERANILAVRKPTKNVNFREIFQGHDRQPSSSPLRRKNRDFRRFHITLKEVSQS